MDWISRLFRSGSNEEDIGEKYAFQHYTDALQTIKDLKSSGEEEELERVLWWGV